MSFKKTLLLGGVFLLLGSAKIEWLMKQPLWPAEFMSRQAVCKRWGEYPLDEKKFKSSRKNRAIRAKMACSLLKKQQKYIGLGVQKIRGLFGPPTGHFFNESFNAYLINTATKKDKNVYQILFLIGEDQKISEIKVHKNCCYN